MSEQGLYLHIIGNFSFFVLPWICHSSKRGITTILSRIQLYLQQNEKGNYNLLGFTSILNLFSIISKVLQTINLDQNFEKEFQTKLGCSFTYFINFCFLALGDLASHVGQQLMFLHDSNCFRQYLFLWELVLSYLHFRVKYASVYSISLNKQARDFQSSKFYIVFMNLNSCKFILLMK